MCRKFAFGCFISFSQSLKELAIELSEVNSTAATSLVGRIYSWSSCSACLFLLSWLSSQKFKVYKPRQCFVKRIKIQVRFPRMKTSVLTVWEERSARSLFPFLHSLQGTEMNQYIYSGRKAPSHKMQMVCFLSSSHLFLQSRAAAHLTPVTSARRSLVGREKRDCFAV